MGEFTGRGVVITGALGIHGTWFADAFAREGGGNSIGLLVVHQAKKTAL